MALVIEDGTGVSGANSYVTVAEAKAWVEARGLEFMETDEAIEGLILQAMDLVESFRARFSGSKTDSAQALQWPRTDAYLDGVELDDDVIPTELKSAVIQLAYDGQTNELQALGSGREVVREKVDVLEVEYAKRGSSTLQVVFNKALAFLTPLFKSSGGRVRTLRI